MRKLKRDRFTGDERKDRRHLDQGTEQQSENHVKNRRNARQANREKAAASSAAKSSCWARQDWGSCVFTWPYFLKAAADTSRIADDELVKMRRLGQTDLTPELVRAGTVNGTKPESNLAYAHLQVPLPQNLKNSEIFAPHPHHGSHIGKYYLMVRIWIRFPKHHVRS